MKFILEKKVNTNILSVILYVSFCFSSFYFSRGALAYAASLAGLNSAILTNSIVAFFVGGIVPIALYELLTNFVFKSMRNNFVHAESMRYSLKYFYIAANIVIGLVSLIYFISPLISVYGNIFIPFLITTLFFALYLWFVCCHFVEKPRISHILAQLCGVYIFFYAVLTALNIFGSIM